MNIGLWLERSATRWPTRPALYLGTDLVADYAGFDAGARALAGWLAAQGVAPGDRVAIFMKNTPDYLIVQYGAWYAGAVVVPINAKLHGREAAWIMEDSRTKLAFATPALAEALKEAGSAARVIDTTGAEFAHARGHAPIATVAERAADDLVWLFYTSGTTGRPKGVMITNRMLINMALDYQVDVDRVTGADTALYAAPLSHGAGIYNLMHVQMGARHVCPVSAGFEPDEIFDLARYFERVHMFAAPTMVKRMTLAAQKSGETGRGLRTIVYGGGPMYVADIVEAADVFGPIFVQIYGQGECPMAISALSREEVADRSHPRWRARLGSVGRAQASVMVKIGDETGQELQRGQAGEIMVRGDTVMPGYWQNAEATEKTLVDGWLCTGDVGFMDDEGYVTMQDRSKDMIISGGTNIYPREVEEALLIHDSVQEVAVVGQPDVEWGELVVAFVVPAAGHGVDHAVLDAHCLARIARFKRPKSYVEVSELPKNNYGKVLKTELRKRLAAEADAKTG
ncbi:AMP-binding protein [Lutimaribacter sp. EGI FJ00015]|uniref:AMP-binding protein n=1 Tax=Lutimaribacter degradans TaxID=2945989 RepID=A0ACC5ZRY3_9RHOB|nr:AMP-binding protein [Lutimaribacter sp. EGI FJ00013]MCM2560895.1 AMP-binding protein [Lutimaribacter sp. EGI FJ00013]MCO0612160.1 AMP-binding protein [Lutimaribacter sp. EGI FJ00015]MCO0634720.1 AMP-binding protein [Lutimaribacter sp. EGI FJ00014]